jgi:hypothetical protein
MSDVEHLDCRQASEGWDSPHSSLHQSQSSLAHRI